MKDGLQGAAGGVLREFGGSIRRAQAIRGGVPRNFAEFELLFGGCFKITTDSNPLTYHRGRYAEESNSVWR
jgi:hypothetical protein